MVRHDHRVETDGEADVEGHEEADRTEERCGLRVVVATSKRHYNQFRSVEASRLYNKTLARLLDRVDDLQVRAKPSPRRRARCAS